MVGVLVRKTRQVRGLTQVDLGRRTGLSQNYISKLESGLVDLPQRGTLDALAGALDLPVGDFYRAAGVLPLDGEPDDRRVVAELPPVLIEAWRSLVRKHPELGPQLEAASGDPDFGGQIVDLSAALGLIIKGWIGTEIDKPGDGV